MFSQPRYYPGRYIQYNYDESIKKTLQSFEYLQYLGNPLHRFHGYLYAAGVFRI